MSSGTDSSARSIAGWELIREHASEVSALSSGGPKRVDQAWRIRGLQLQGVSLWDIDAREVDLDNFTLVDVDADASDWTAATIASGTFRNCKFRKAVCADSNISNVEFIGCELFRTDLSSCRLASVRFVDCVLRRTDFVGARLTDVTFERCEIWESHFGLAHLARVRIVDPVRLGRCTLGWRSAVDLEPPEEEFARRIGEGLDQSD